MDLEPNNHALQLREILEGSFFSLTPLYLPIVAPMSAFFVFVMYIIILIVVLCMCLACHRITRVWLSN